MRILLLVLASAACGAPRPAAVANTQPTSTCAQIAPILVAKNPLERPGLNRDFDAALADAIARSCTRDAWPIAMIDCIPQRPQPFECLEPLTPEQEASFHERVDNAVDRWSAAHPTPIDAGDADPYVDCELSLGDPAGYPPAVAANAPERDWLLQLRQRVLIRACDKWSEEAKRCLISHAARQPAACLSKALEPEDLEALTAELRALGQVAAKMARVRKQPSELSCARVAAAHYTEARWEDAKDAYSDDPESVRIKRESRERMAAACTNQRWDESLRSCIVAGGGDACLIIGDIGVRVWAFPALGVKPRKASDAP